MKIFDHFHNLNIQKTRQRKMG